MWVSVFTRARWYLALCLFLSCQPEQEQSVPSPNFIFIMADDLGYADLGVYGQQRIKTPNLDRMANEGMLFTQFYAGTAVCAPSRSVLMTGMHNGHTPVRGNKQHGYRNGQLPLPDSAITMAEHLKSKGYFTGMIGKWGLGEPGTSGDPLIQGWDFYFGYTDQVLAHNYYPEFLWRNGEKIMLDNQVQYLDSTLWHDGLGSFSTKQEEYSHDLFIDEAKKFIDENQHQKFFLYLPLTIPHDNGEQVDSLRFEVPDQGPYADESWDRRDRDYAAMITRMDNGIGEIMSQLVDLQLDSNTVVFFTSDNGPMKGPTTVFFNSNGSLRGEKRDLYEGGIREPFIVRWPGHIPAGEVSDHLGGFWDVLPTLLDLADEDLPSGLDGISFKPTLLGEGEQLQHPYLYWEFHEGTGAQAIRQGHWKAVKLEVKQRTDFPMELYDLSSDPAEARNIAADHPEKVIELENLMKEARTPSKDFPLAVDE